MAALYQIATSDDPVLRDVACLYLLDPAPEVRQTLCRIVTDQASPAVISPETFRRMIALRNWLPNAERHHLDTAIKAVRRKKVECAPWPQRVIEQMLATNMDGAGAQSIFAIVKEGRKYVIASLLVKQGVGVADAWCIRDNSKADINEFLSRILAEMDSHPIESEYLHLLVPHILAIGLRAANVPSANLLDFVEAVGIDKWQPSELTPEDILALLEQEINPIDIDPNAVAHVIGKSRNWVDMYEFLGSWFEEDSEVEAVLDKKLNSKTSVKINAIVKSILEPRRDKWTERFLWTALWLKQKNDLLSPWVDFFVIGRELHQGRQIKDIPIMVDIAKTTVTVDMEKF